MTEDRIIEYEFSEMEDELYAYEVEYDTMGGKHRSIIAKGEEAYAMKYGRRFGE